MKNFKQIKNVLFDEIKKIDNLKINYVVDPSKDFTRVRVLTFTDVMAEIITQEASSIKVNLLKSFKTKKVTPTASAFIQQRDKIKVEAFQDLLKNFTDIHTGKKLFKGYRLIAFDGSKCAIYNNKLDFENYNNNDYTSLHINACYDLLNKVFVDIIIHGGAKFNEQQACIEMLKRFDAQEKTIFICDRYYESYNIFETIQLMNKNYVIRVKDVASNGIISALELPDTDTFDIDVKKILTTKQTKKVKKNKGLYKFVPKNKRLDFMGEDEEYEMNFRLVRVKLSEDSYETIVTNLPRETITSQDLKDLYSKRWGIEIAFRDLKYGVSLNALHATKPEAIKQEIYARILLLNFTNIVIMSIPLDKKQTEHEYQINFTLAVRIIRDYLKDIYRKVQTYDLAQILKKELLPIRDGRQFPRNLKTKGFIGFTYKF